MAGEGAVVRRILTWYDAHARDLPWRRPDPDPWAVMVSEFMLQQTPVERVRGPWAAWMERWPSPAARAAGLGYPRRALRLHAAAVAITRDHDGVVPSETAALLALPGVGSYTAAAIASFAYGRRAVVLDTNVRRVLARIAFGIAHPAASPSRAELAVAESYVPRDAARAKRWAYASMELGAVVCVARTPHCAVCPVQRSCAWRAAGYPAGDGPPRRGQAYDGTDRQCRGALLAVLRSSDEPVETAELNQAWPEPVQRERCLASLVTDGLAVAVGVRWALPT